MAFLRFWASLWIFCLVVCHFQIGTALFLSHKKKSVLNYLVKEKLAKLHAALSDDHDYDVAHYHHYHYEPVPLLVVPHHHHGVYKSGLGHYLNDPWHLSHHSYHSHHGWGPHHEY
ncbi:UNVERIFIED_CONTAM: hypothetical protein PYX00_001225 [Menopon gallinae]|uniref:Histidine-rich glycoprotein n=1 Tax=Menopon gallinae TaxID=328185 RepID=A0AAW2IDA3_9NEOP